MTSLDRTFCASPNCKNECGRQLTPELRAKNVHKVWLSFAYFCDVPALKVHAVIPAGFNRYKHVVEEKIS